MMTDQFVGSLTFVRIYRYGVRQIPYVVVLLGKGGQCKATCKANCLGVAYRAQLDAQIANISLQAAFIDIKASSQANSLGIAAELLHLCAAACSRQAHMLSMQTKIKKSALAACC